MAGHIHGCPYQGCISCPYWAVDRTGPKDDLVSTGEEWCEGATPSLCSSSLLLENGGALGEADCSGVVCSREPSVPKSGETGMEDTRMSLWFSK